MNAARGSRTQKAVLIVLFVPSVDRDERPIDQDAGPCVLSRSWVRCSVALRRSPEPEGCGAMMSAINGSSGTTRLSSIATRRRPMSERKKQRVLGEFCNEMGRATNQGEVGLVIDNVYHAIRFE
jgi:hypothetical protein